MDKDYQLRSILMLFWENPEIDKRKLRGEVEV